jgi:cell fate regulator YaaT (PSP1 superfamily)
MKMAKDQSLFLNPAKFSGVCGKLMCCLRYEHEFYKYARECLPAVGAVIETERGTGKVVDVNVVSNTLTVEFDGPVIVIVPACELNLTGCCRRHGFGCQMKESNCKPIREQGTGDVEQELEDDQQAVEEVAEDTTIIDSFPADE